MIDISLENKISLMLKSIDLELYDIEFVKENNEMILRIYIFNKGGIDLDRCTKAHNLLSPMLDVELPSMQNYILEISSPGLERNLKKERHFLLSIGELIEVRLKDKSTLKGILKEYKNETIKILVDEKVDQKEVELNLQECKRVRTYFEW